MLLKSLYTQQKKLSLLTKDCNLPIFTASEAITNLTQFELSREESDLFKSGLYFENLKYSLLWKDSSFDS